MRIEAEMNSQDIQKFFDTYMGQACTSALCMRIEQSARQQAEKATGTEKDYYVSFANTMKALAETERKREATLFGMG